MAAKQVDIDPSKPTVECHIDLSPMRHKLYLPGSFNRQSCLAPSKTRSALHSYNGQLVVRMGIVCAFYYIDKQSMHGECSKTPWTCPS